MEGAPVVVLKEHLCSDPIGQGNRFILGFTMLQRSCQTRSNTSSTEQPCWSEIMMTDPLACLKQGLFDPGGVQSLQVVDKTDKPTMRRISTATSPHPVLVVQRNWCPLMTQRHEGGTLRNLFPKTKSTSRIHEPFVEHAATPPCKHTSSF